MQDARKVNLLELRLSGQEEGTYHVEGIVDGKPLLLHHDDDEVDIPFGLLPSIDRDGEYFMVTCRCGDDGCAGYFDPVVVTHEGDVVRWVCGDEDWDFTFNQEQYAKEIRRLIDEGRRQLQHESYLPFGQAHQNLDLFRSEAYEESLPPAWENDQKNRAEERSRKQR